LADQLNNTGDYKEALKEISKAEDGLAALTDKIQEESIGKLAEQLDSLEETQALAQALSDRSSADLERALEQLKEQLEQAENKEELTESLQEALERAMGSMADGEIKNSLASASNSLSSSQTGAATEQLGDAMKQAINASNSMGDAKYALQQMRSSIARAAGDSKYAQGTGNPSGQNSNSGNQGNENQNSGNSSNGNSGEKKFWERTGFR
jgi:DNA repair exonuclease SbcCD ATPase subunit